MSTPSPPTAEQVATQQAEHWNGPGGQRWADEHHAIDAVIGPLGMIAIERLAPQPGEAIVDVGCGFGATTVEIGRRVTSAGRVLGVDLSGPQLEIARAKARQETLRHVHFAHGDVTDHPFDDGAHDAAFSRFGVMFFGDPVAAFANVRAGLVRGGRLVFVCWRALEDNEWVTLPLQAATEHLPPPDLGPPGSAGPFSLCDSRRIRDILGDAGYTDVVVDALDRPLHIGPDAEHATEWFLKVGPVSRMVAEVDEGDRDRVRRSLREALGSRQEPGGVSLQGAAWIVAARAG